jgi:hypothetical protein
MEVELSAFSKYDLPWFIDLDWQTSQLIIDQDMDRLAAKDAVAQENSDDHYSPAKVGFVEFCARQCIATSDLVASRIVIEYKSLKIQCSLSKQEARSASPRTQLMAGPVVFETGDPFSEKAQALSGFRGKCRCGAAIPVSRFPTRPRIRPAAERRR